MSEPVYVDAPITLNGIVVDAPITLNEIAVDAPITLGAGSISVTGGVSLSTIVVDAPIILNKIVVNAPITMGTIGEKGDQGDAGADGTIIPGGVATTTPSLNDVMKFNGSTYVPVPEGTDFAFSIASFTNGQSSTQLIGSGIWKSGAALSFTAVYNNGPPVSEVVSSTSWGSELSLSSGSAVSTEATPYPTTAGQSVTFTLTADGKSDNQSTSFYNYEFYGVTTKKNGYTEADIEAMTGRTISNDNTQAWPAITAGATEYLLFAFPVRLGLVSFWVGGFEGGFELPETVTITNPTGFQEDYYIWRSTNIGLGATVVETK